MTDKSRPPSGLTRIVVRRFLLFAFAAAVIQTVVVFADYYFKDRQLASLMVDHEANLLQEGLSIGDHGLRFSRPRDLPRYAIGDSDYLTRIRTMDGRIVYSNCDQSCAERLLPAEINPPDAWARMLQPGKPIAVAGGRAFNLAGAKAFIEVAILHDREAVMWRVIGHEFADHLLVPMSLMFLFLLVGALLSVRFALAPVERAAADAEHVDPLDPSHRLNIEGMPREIANLGDAVNRTLSRVRSLMTAQRVFVTAVAHEVRTPLAMMKLELGHIDHPRARKVESDIDDLAQMVGQIAALGRLESADRSIFGTFDLTAAAKKVVADIAPWVYDKERAVAFVDHGKVVVDGHMPLIVDAIRNLIENAVKYTPRGANIEVAVGPGDFVIVSDDAGLYSSAVDGRASGDRIGLGLEIVRRIMDIHRGRLETAVEPGRRTTMALIFEQRAAA
jgi:signal transduction histidine kinase